MKKTIIILALVAFYIVTCVPVGLFIYSLKSSNGIDVFSKTGFHSYIACLQEQANLINAKE